MRMGKRRKSGSKPTADVYQLSKHEKSFLYDNFNKAKSIKAVRIEYLKKFPNSCVMSKKLIHKMYVLFQKEKFKRKALAKSTSLNNNSLHSKNLKSGSNDLVQNSTSLQNSRLDKNCTVASSSSSKKCMKKKRKKRRTTSLEMNSVNTNTSENALQTNCDVRSAPRTANALQPHSAEEANGSSSQVITIDDSVTSSSFDTTILNASAHKENVQAGHSTHDPVSSPTITSGVGIWSDIFKRIKDKEKSFNSIITQDPTIQNKNPQTLKKHQQSVLNNNKLANLSKSLNSQVNYPESSTPQKTKSCSNKISISPIATQRRPPPETRFEAILEISDDDEEQEVNNLITIDETGFTKEKEEDLLTIDEAADTVSALIHTQLSSFNSKTSLQRPLSHLDFYSSIDLTSQLATAKDKHRVDVCYDLTTDDDLLSNGLMQHQNDPLDGFKHTVNEFSKPINTNTKRNFGSNIYNPQDVNLVRKGLRMVVIDGSNVAMSHGLKKRFSVEGLKICIDYFLNRGHVVKAFVPRFRCKMHKSTNPHMLMQLEEAGHVVFTPSREIQGKHIMSYDDRFIVQCAAEYGGVIVSGDNFRDLLHENLSWRQTIEERLLNFTWVGNLLMFPQDPLGRGGPNLKSFLTH